MSGREGRVSLDGLLERVREDLQDLPRHQWDHYLWDLCSELVRFAEVPAISEKGVTESTAQATGLRAEAQ